MFSALIGWLEKRSVKGSDQHYLKFGKKELDAWISLFLIIWLAPLMVLLIAVKWLIDGAPLFYEERRFTKKGAPFTIIKLCTMRPECAVGSCAKHAWLPSDGRITWLGRWLRALKLDELPQLYVNIFFNEEMSLIGPRPWNQLSTDDAATIDPVLLLERYQSPAGLFGLSALRVGRPNDRRSVRRTLLWDRWYCQNCSFPLDCLIMMAIVCKFTLFAVLRMLARSKVR